MEKTLLVSSLFPPVMNGPSILIGNLFRHFPKGSYVVLTSDPEQLGYRKDSESKLQNGRSYYCSMLRGSRFLSQYKRDLLNIPRLILRGLAIIRKEKVATILGVFPFIHFTIAAYYLSVISHKPLFLFFFDDMRALYTSRKHKWIAGIYEKKINKRAKGIFVMTEFLRERYKQLYGKAAVVIPHSVDRTLYKSIKDHNYPSHAKKKPRRIVFTGNIYAEHLEALQNIVKVVNNYPSSELELCLYTPRNREYFKKHELLGPNIHYGHALRDEIPKIQQDADILFLPLSFNPPRPDIVWSACPSKLPEYLASGVPILIHAPPNSFLSCYGKEKGFALVVDRNNIDALKKAVKQLIYDDSLRERLVLAAQKVLHLHSSTMLSRKLQVYLLDKPYIITTDGHELPKLPKQCSGQMDVNFREMDFERDF